MFDFLPAPLKRLRSSYLRNRLITSLIVFFVVYLLNFIIPRLEPGDYLSTINTMNILPQTQQALIQSLGLNKSLYQQFITYVQQTFGTFPPNFGVSYSHYPLSVWTMVLSALPWTLLLVFVSQSISWPVGVLLGSWLAWRRGSKADSAMFVISNFMWGVPSYWLASILIFVFAIELRVFPPALTASGVVGTKMTLAEVWDVLDHAFLPVLTLVLLSTPIHALVMRNTMVSTLKEDFISAAETRGLKTRTLIFNHAARNALLPSITALALELRNSPVGHVLGRNNFFLSRNGLLNRASSSFERLPNLGRRFLFLCASCDNCKCHQLT